MSQSPPPKIYSYVRCSSERQLKGDSFARQEELIKKYEREKGIELDDKLRITDPGVSAYTGKNVRVGKLAGFLEAIKEKKVAAGSVLILESLDRLTRMKPRQSLPLFLDIINAGVTIVTLADRCEHSEKTIDADGGDMVLYGSLIALTQAHAESKRKSDRLKSAWIGKRKNITKVFYTSRVPSWVKLADDRTTMELIPEKAAIVLRMFELCLGGHHSEGIARLFHKEKVPIVGSKRSEKWTFSYVVQTLRNPAVTGEFTPNRMENGKRVPAGPAIPNYYPQVVTKDFFNKVQFIMDSRSKGTKGGRIAGKTENIFRKILFCGYCGAPVYRTAKGRYYKGATRRTLLCRNAKDGTGCFYVGWEYDEFEKAFFASATELRIAMADKFDGKPIREELEKLLGEQKELSAKLAGLMSIAESAAESGENTPRVLLQRISELEKRREEVEAARVKVERKLSAGMDGTGPLKKLEGIPEEIKNDGTRKIVRDLIGQVLSRIDLFPAGSKMQFAKLRSMHAMLLRDHAGEHGFVNSTLREMFDRRKVRFFQPVLNLPGAGKRLSFSNTGTLVLEAARDKFEDAISPESEEELFEDAANFDWSELKKEYEAYKKQK